MEAIWKAATGSKAWCTASSGLERLLPDRLQSFSSPLLAFAIISVTVNLTWTLWNAIYNLYLHPLAHFPGPRSAALSRKWLYQNSQNGCVEEVFEKIHQQYRCHAIRIAPNELHIDDVSLYKKIYSQNDPWTKDGDFYAAFGTPHSVFVETDHVLHRERRRLLNPFFSRTGVLKVEWMIIEKVKALGERLKAQRPEQRINLYNAFRCLTVDIISDYASGQCLNQIKSSDDNFFGTYLEAFDAFADLIWDMCYNPVLRAVVNWTPEMIAKRTSKAAAAFLRLMGANTSALHAYRANPDVGRPVVYSALDSCSETEAVAEATDILAAGSDTTAFTLSTGLWHIMNNPKLKKELAEALFKHIPDKNEIPHLPALEAIPILSATVKECIRVATAVPGRLPRIVPDHAVLIVDNKKVPAGTVVGMSAYTMHRSQELWGLKADTFDPHRWLTGDDAAMEQNMVSFSKGRRSCIGQPLAFAEMHIVLAMMLRNFDFVTAPGSAGADGMDRFTSMVKKPGILACIKVLEK